MENLIFCAVQKPWEGEVEDSKGPPVLIKKLLEENLKVEKWAKRVWS